MTLQEQLAAVQKRKAEKSKEMETLMSGAITKGATPDKDTETQIEAIEKDIEALEKNEKRIEKMIADVAKAAQTATPVAGENPAQAAASAAGDPAPQKIEVKSNLEKGIGFAMAVKASAVAAKSNGAVSAIDLLKGWNAPEQVQNYLIQKAKIGTTTDSTFAAPLVDTVNLTGEFIELLRPATILGRMQGFRNVPFNVSIPSQTSATSVNWVGEAAAKPVTDMGFSSTTLLWAKLAGIVLLSDELIRFSNPAADRLVRDDLVSSVAQFLDQQFLDPAKAEATASPASILNGVTPITASGVTAAAYDADLQALINTFVTNNLSLDGAYFIMSETRAAQIGLLRDALGNTYFNGMTFGAGNKTLLGLPVVTSETAANRIVLVKPSEILLADDGGVDFGVSNEATVTYNNGTADVTVNLFQNNLTAIRAERYIRWKKRRAQAASYIQYA